MDSLSSPFALGKYSWLHYPIKQIARQWARMVFGWSGLGLAFIAPSFA